MHACRGGGHRPWRLRSHVSRKRFLSLRGRPCRSPPSAAVKAIMETILYTPMVGNSNSHLTNPMLS
jgi:hypothetical protein